MPQGTGSVAGLAAAFGRLADVVLVLGNGDNRFDGGLRFFRQILGLQALGFLNDGNECLGDIIGSHGCILLKWDVGFRGKSQAYRPGRLL
jgi:hypothetical protein